MMKWNEIRQEYPSQWVMLKILKSHEDGEKEFIDDMDVIKVIKTDYEATDMLVNCSENEIVFHTSNEAIFSEIRNIFFSFRS